MLVHGEVICWWLICFITLTFGVQKVFYEESDKVIFLVANSFYYT